jgi:hypothetical protein
VAHIEDHIHLPLQESPAIIRLQENRILFHKFPYLTPELYCLWISGDSVLHLLSQEEMDRVVHYKPRIMQHHSQAGSKTGCPWWMNGMHMAAPQFRSSTPLKHQNCKWFSHCRT